MAKKSVPRDPNLEHPAVKLYIDICHSTPNHVQREAIVATVVEKLSLYEEILRQFMVEGRPPHRVDWTLERYCKALPMRIGGQRSEVRGQKEPPVSDEELNWMRSRTRLAVESEGQSR